MIDRLAARLPLEDAQYIHHLLSALFYAIAMVALLRLALSRGPSRALDAAIP